MNQLKIHLQQLGPLRPLAWENIINNCLGTHLRENENFIREEDTIAYLSEGLLKEYDARQRKKPSIINFIQNHQFIITRRQNQPNFIRACMPSMIYYMKGEQVDRLHREFPELQQMYRYLCENYDVGLAYRQILLEEKTSKTRIAKFISSHRHILPFLKKKDIANYLHLDYNHFVRLYHQML